MINLLRSVSNQKLYTIFNEVLFHVIETGPRMEVLHAIKGLISNVLMNLSAEFIQVSEMSAKKNQQAPVNAMEIVVFTKKSLRRNIVIKNPHVNRWIWPML